MVGEHHHARGEEDVESDGDEVRRQEAPGAGLAEDAEEHGHDVERGRVQVEVPEDHLDLRLQDHPGGHRTVQEDVGLVLAEEQIAAGVHGAEPKDEQGVRMQEGREDQRRHVAAGEGQHHEAEEHHRDRRPETPAPLERRLELGVALGEPPPVEQLIEQLQQPPALDRRPLSVGRHGP